MFYAGIGSRETPEEILVLMKEIAENLQDRGYTLRSGGAKGADRAFESGAGIYKQIFYADDCTEKALNLAEKYHPAWDRCSDYAKKLHGRNGMILLGDNLLEPAQFVICWTHGAKLRGGTAQALRIAKDLDIPIYNLADYNHRTSMLAYLGKA